MDVGYYIVNTHLILLIFSMIVSAIAIVRRDYDALAWAVILLSYTFITISYGFPFWFRKFSALYGIVWGGGG